MFHLIHSPHLVVAILINLCGTCAPDWDFEQQPLNQINMNQLVMTKNRVQSIDILRGIVMIIMALDHVRDFFHTQAFQSDPIDPATTTPILYITRWITHLCAPTL